jgi:hypothetical protein
MSLLDSEAKAVFATHETSLPSALDVIVTGENIRWKPARCLRSACRLFYLLWRRFASLPTLILYLILLAFDICSIGHRSLKACRMII